MTTQAVQRLMDSVRAPRDVVIQVRLDQTLDERINRVVAFARDNGATGVTRSSVVREAIEAFLDGAEEEMAAADSG